MLSLLISADDLGRTVVAFQGNAPLRFVAIPLSLLSAVVVWQAGVGIMTLTNRLTLFALAALGVILVGFSGATYALAATHLKRQLNDRATATLDTLVAATEAEADGLEWEAKDRRILLRGDGEPPVWAVFDELGQRLEGTDDPLHPLDAFAATGPGEAQDRATITWHGNRWRVVRRTLLHPHPEAVNGDATPKRHRALVFVTAWPVAPVSDTLRTLAWSLGGVSATLWLLAAAVGRRVCRRALAPVSRMREAATAISGDDLGARLPVPAARDELHELARAFNGLLTRLQDSSERQRRFAGEASHQLRTPLTAMLGQLEVALRREREPDEYRRVLTSAVKQSDRLREIVEALLFLARADAEALTPALEPVDLVAWLPRHMAETWATHPRSNDLQISGVSAGPSLSAFAHPSLLGQALDNLIDNAFKYSSPGSPVRVGLRVEASSPVILVEDTGVGIVADDRDKVFTPFFRSEVARQDGIPGVGLGLAVTARIVKSFGGRVRLRAGPGPGCQFEIGLQLSPNQS